MRTHFTQRRAEKKMEGLYDLDSSLINNRNEGLYNLPSVIQLHVFSHARDITWGGWIRLHWITEEHEMGHKGRAEFFFSFSATSCRSFNQLQWAACKKKKITFLPPVCLFDCLAFWIDGRKTDGLKRDKYHASSPASSPGLVTLTCYCETRRGTERERSRSSSSHVTPCIFRASCDNSSHLSHVCVLCHNIILTSLLSAK